MGVDQILIGIVIASSSTFTLAVLAPKVRAQSVPPAGVTIPPTAPDTIERTIPKPTELPQTSPPELPSSPSPNLQTPPVPPTSPAPSTLPSERFLVKKVEVRGSTVLHKQIATLIKPFFNHEVTFDDLIGLRSAITQLYVDHGYITSGAFLLNNQDLSSGVVQIQVVEGELERIDISGLRRLRAGYVRSRIALAATRPLNRRHVEAALQLLQLNPLIARVNAELTAGSTPGHNVLEVRVREAPPFHAGIAVDNYQVPSIGSEQGSVFLADDDLLGFGDALSAEYGITSGLNTYDLGYTIPFNARNGTLSLRYIKDNSNIIEAPFQNLGIRSNTRTLSIGVRQPVVQSPKSEFALGLAFDLRRNPTFILNNIPFSFTEGPDNGKSKVTVIRFSQDFVKRGARQVLAARSQFSVGLDALGATINNTGTDGRFFAWLGQFQLVQQLSPRALLLARIDAQLTPNSLLPLEQFAIGGVDTVRGYRQNQLVTDNAILGSVEVRFPLTSNPRVLQLGPFFDIGTAWNNLGPDPNPATIAGLGLGLRWEIGPDLAVRLDYGVPLIAVKNRGNSLQDNGFYFSVRYQPF